MANTSVLTIGPNGGAKVYTSARAASRALSGTGSEGMRGAIGRRLVEGGGFVGGVWVQATSYPTGGTVR